MSHNGRPAVSSASTPSVAVIGNPSWKAYKTLSHCRSESSTAESISATGVLQPKTTVDIKSNAGGEILLLKVDVGDRVRKGDLIAEIDPTDARTQLDQANADQRSADWKIAQSQNTVEFGELVDKQTIANAAKALTAYNVTMYGR